MQLCFNIYFDVYLTIFSTLHIMVSRCRHWCSTSTATEPSKTPCRGKTNFSCCPLRPRTTPFDLRMYRPFYTSLDHFPRGKSILGVIYGVLLWADMNATELPKTPCRGTYLTYGTELNCTERNGTRDGLTLGQE